MTRRLRRAENDPASLTERDADGPDGRPDEGSGRSPMVRPAEKTRSKGLQRLDGRLDERTWLSPTSRKRWGWTGRAGIRFEAESLRPDDLEIEDRPRPPLLPAGPPGVARLPVSSRAQIDRNGTAQMMLCWPRCHRRRGRHNRGLQARPCRCPRASDRDSRPPPPSTPPADARAPCRRGRRGGPWWTDLPGSSARAARRLGFSRANRDSS